MCSRRLLWVWLVWGLSWSAFGQVTEQDRQQALEAFANIETFTWRLQANSKARETYLTEIETSLNERQTLLDERDRLLSEREASVLARESLQTEKENSLLGRENSLQAITTLTEESKKLYEKAERRSRFARVLGILGTLGGLVVGVGLGGLR